MQQKCRQLQGLKNSSLKLKLRSTFDPSVSNCIKGCLHQEIILTLILKRDVPIRFAGQYGHFFFFYDRAQFVAEMSVEITSIRKRKQSSGDM